jgi:hypothetical protein
LISLPTGRIGIFPTLTASTAELHDYLGLEAGRQLGMPLDAFTDQAYQGLTEGKDQIVIGCIGPADTFKEIIDKRRTAFENLAEMMRKRH